MHPPKSLEAWESWRPIINRALVSYNGEWARMGTLEQVSQRSQITVGLVAWVHTSPAGWKLGLGPGWVLAWLPGSSEEIFLGRATDPSLDRPAAARPLPAARGGVRWDKPGWPPAAPTPL